MKFELYDHNRTAYASAVEMMETAGKAAIIHPTGTGKSFIGFQLAADHPQEQILWLSPSRYIFETQLENLKAASDRTTDDKTTDGEAVGGKIADIGDVDGKNADIEGSNDKTTDSEAADGNTTEIGAADGRTTVCEAENGVLKNITFLTYAKLMLMNTDEIAELRPAYIILDEFHCCGAQMWGQGVQRLLDAYPEVPILGLSATNIRYLDNQRDMAEELFDGNVASEITLGEAIVRGILSPPKYVLSIFKYQDDLAKYEARVRNARSKAVRDEGERYLEALRRALEHADGLDVIFDKHMTDRTGKYIVFCANKEHMDEMMKHQEWFAKVDPHPHVYSLYAADPSTSKEFDAFKADDDRTHLRLLYCIDALNQGIHVPDISGVILLRPTVSPIIYKQQIGRALSATKKDNCPVIFDIVINIENLYSIGSIEEEMEIATAYYRSLGESAYVVNERFKIIDEVRDCVELFDRLNSVLTASWDLMYEKARSYAEEYGSLDVPQRFITADGYSLGSWVSTQRAIRAGTMQGSLTEEQIQKLTDIGMVWESRTELAWAKNYAAAQAYHKENGTLNVPAGYITEDGVALGEWIKMLRKWKSSGIHQKYLTEDRIAQLDALGMAWDPHDYYWEQMYQKASEYYQAHGNLNVPNKYITEDGMRLGAWVHRQRSLGRERDAENETEAEASKVCEAESGKAHEVGTDMALKKVKEETSSLSVKTQDKSIRPENPSQDESVLSMNPSQHRSVLSEKSKQNIKASSKCLSEEHYQRLSAIGMIWADGNEANWDRNYELAKQYYHEHGNLSMPKKYETCGVNLGYWVTRQKAAARSGKLTDYRKEKLEAIGIVQETETDAWELRARLARKYVEENEVRYISQGVVIDGIWIGKWLAVQRKALEAGELSTKQQKLLEGIPLRTKGEEAWDNAYTLAEEYYEEHGNLNVPKKYISSNGFGLGNWISYQRKLRKQGNLTDEQIQKLESIGIVWETQKAAAINSVNQ